MVLKYSSIAIEPALWLEGVRRGEDGRIVVIYIMGERYACLKIDKVSVWRVS